MLEGFSFPIILFDFHYNGLMNVMMGITLFSLFHLPEMIKFKKIHISFDRFVSMIDKNVIEDLQAVRKLYTKFIKPDHPGNFLLSNSQKF